MVRFFVGDIVDGICAVINVVIGYPNQGQVCWHTSLLGQSDCMYNCKTRFEGHRVLA